MEASFGVCSPPIVEDISLTFLAEGGRYLTCCAVRCYENRRCRLHSLLRRYLPEVYVATFVFHEGHFGKVFQLLRFVAWVQEVKTLM